MKNVVVTFRLIMLVVLVATAAAAHDLSKATRLLCSTSSATICHADGECESGPPWTWNIPDFVEADLDARTLVEEGLKIAGSIDIYTNQHITIEELGV